MNSKVVSTKEMHEPKGPVLVLWQASVKEDQWIHNAFAEVHERLDEYIKEGFVQLGIWDSEENNTFQEHLRTLLSRDNWEQWERRGWVPPEWEIAKRGEKREVSIIIIVENKEEVLEERLKRLQKVVRSEFPGFEAKVAVVWIGDRLPHDFPKDSKGKINLHLKVWLGVVAVGGEKVSEIRRQHTLSTLLVVLASTDWGRSFPVGEENWWAVGTSSIVVDYNARLRWLVSEVVRAFLRQISKGITPEEESVLRKSAREKVEETKKQWANDIETVLGEKGWKSEVVSEPGGGIYIKSTSFVAGLPHPLLEMKGGYSHNESDSKVRGRSLFARLWGGIVNTIAYYLDVIRLWIAARGEYYANRAVASKKWGEEYEQIYGALYETLRLDNREEGKGRFFDDLPEQVGYLVNRSRGSASLLVSQEARDSVLPMGVEAAKVWVDEIWKGIFNVPWLRGEERHIGLVREVSELGMKVQPDDWRNKGETDAAWLENYWRWYLREQEAFMYPEVAALKGMIGWPMLYAALILFRPDMQGVKGWLISLGLLFLLLVAELIWRWQKKERMISHLGNRSREFLRRQIQGIMGKALRKALLSGGRLAWLYTVRQALEEYLHLMREHLGKFIEEPKSFEEENMYWLVDGSDNSAGTAGKEEMVARVIEKADLAAAEGQINMECWKGANVNVPSREYEGLLALIVGRLVERLLDEKEGKASALVLWNDALTCLEEAAEKYAREVVGNLEDLIYILPEREKALREGWKWVWLWERAYPLGKVSHTPQEFTTMVVPNRFSLLGPEGTGSRFWDNTWNVARSILPYEVSCIRGVKVSLQKEN